MSYMTDETMDEIAQFYLDSSWEFENDEFEIDVLFDCIHENAVVTEYADKAGTFFAVWECPDCGGIGECAKEY
jgi:hypothetical protein